MTANSGAEALSLAAKEGPKIVLLDIRMLGMSGLEVLRELKKSDPQIKVIMVTIMDDQKTKKEARDLGADEFVTKPFSSEHIEDLVRKQVERLIAEKNSRE